MKVYPSHKLILGSTRIVRDRLLPDGLSGKVNVEVGQHVNASSVVVTGLQPSDYIIVDVAGALGLDADNDELMRDIIPHKVGDRLDADTPLADYNRRKRRIPKTATKAIVRLVEQGRVILQVRPQTIDVTARLEGDVVEVYEGLGARIQSQGALMQAAWGNGHFVAARFAFEPGFEYGNADSPQGGLAKMMGQDVTLSNIRGFAIILLRSITETDLHVVEDQELAGLVAPSMPIDLREMALALKVPIILTEGFGNLQPSLRLYDILAEKYPSSAMFDAAMPDHRRNIRPEIIVPTGGAIQRNVLEPDTTTPLSVGMRVVVQRAPYKGRIGQIYELIEKPVVIENGLRALVAQVQFQSGERAAIPLANLESLGEGGQ